MLWIIRWLKKCSQTISWNQLAQAEDKVWRKTFLRLIWVSETLKKTGMSLGSGQAVLCCCSSRRPSREQTERLLENQNDAQMEAIYARVSKIKQVCCICPLMNAKVTLDIHDDVHAQNMELDDMVCCFLLFSWTSHRQWIHLKIRSNLRLIDSREACLRPGTNACVL